MAKTSGIVTQVRSRETKVGTMYDLVVNGISYGAGKYPPRDIKDGDFVTFEFTENGNFKNLVPRSLRKDDAPAPAAVSAAKAETRTVVAQTDKRQETISKQANLNTAIALVQLQLSNGGLKFPANAKPAAIFEAIEGAVFDTAQRLYNHTTGEDWQIQAATKQVAAAAPQAGGEAPWPEDDLPTD